MDNYLLLAKAANELAWTGERELSMGCIWCPYAETKWEKAIPIWVLTSSLSNGDIATWAKILTTSGTKGSICFDRRK